MNETTQEVGTEVLEVPVRSEVDLLACQRLQELINQYGIETVVNKLIQA